MVGHACSPPGPRRLSAGGLQAIGLAQGRKGSEGEGRGVTHGHAQIFPMGSET